MLPLFRQHLQSSSVLAARAGGQESEGVLRTEGKLLQRRAEEMVWRFDTLSKLILD